jgi:hypothetical protein
LNFLTVKPFRFAQQREKIKMEYAIDGRVAARHDELGETPRRAFVERRACPCDG